MSKADTRFDGSYELGLYKGLSEDHPYRNQIAGVLRRLILDWSSASGPEDVLAIELRAALIVYGCSDDEYKVSCSQGKSFFPGATVSSLSR